MVDLELWTPTKGDLCKPLYTAIEGNYRVRVVSFELGLVKFVKIAHGRTRPANTMMHREFISRFDLVYRDNVVQLKRSA